MNALKTKTNNLPKKVRGSTQPEVESRTYAWATIEHEVMIEELDPGDYALPRSSLVGLLATAAHLDAQAPEELTPSADEALRRMRVAFELCSAYRREILAPAARGVQTPRNEVVRLIGLHARTLSGVAGSDMEEAAGAKVILEQYFGGVTNLRDLESREYWLEVGRVRAGLADSPALRGQLAELVSPRLTARLLQAHEALGAALGMTARDAPPSMLTTAQVLAFLRRRIRWYVVQLLATSRESPEARQRIAGALKPVLEFRERSRRGRGAVEEVEAVDVEDVVAPVVGVPAAPVVMAPVAPARPADGVIA